MRVRLTLRPEGGALWLPRQYNRLIQGVIYSHLDPRLAEELHEKGRVDPRGGRHLKFFTFSRLLGRWRAAGGGMVFFGPLTLVVASPMAEFLESLVTRLVRKGRFPLGESPVALEAVEVEVGQRPRGPLLVEALSPITVYTTFLTQEGRRKTYYYTPWEEEFAASLFKNLARKARVWYGEEVPLEGWIRPYRVSPRDEHVLRYGDTVIKAWTGIYQLELPERLWEMAYHAGLGAKNSQGFGCLGIWEGKGA